MDAGSSLEDQSLIIWLKSLKKNCKRLPYQLGTLILIRDSILHPNTNLIIFVVSKFYEKSF